MMLKILIFNLIYFFSQPFISLLPLNTYAQALDLSYALLSENTILYHENDDSSLSPICFLPSTYFVRVAGEEKNGYYPVVYDDLTGFVKAEHLNKADYEPVTKYAYATLTLSNDGNPITIRSSPDHQNDENILARLDSGCSLKYYGKMFGSAMISAVGNEWYYISFSVNGQKMHGYVYSLYTIATPILDNDIQKVVEPENEENLPPPNNDIAQGATSDNVSDDNKTPETISGVREAIIILALCMPVIVVVCILFKKEKR